MSRLHVVTDRDVLAAYLAGAKTPLDKIRASVHWTTQQGIKIRHGDYGVIPGAFEWMVDERQRPRGVSPLGAVVLAYQPPVGRDLPDPAAQALGVQIPYAEGVQDGFDRDLNPHFLGSLSKRLYMEGVEAGMEIRFEITQRCVRCSSRHFRDEPCPLCEERIQPEQLELASYSQTHNPAGLDEPQ